MFTYNRPSILAKGRNFAEPTRQHLNPYIVAGMDHRIRGSLLIPQSAGGPFCHGYNRETSDVNDVRYALTRS